MTDEQVREALPALTQDPKPQAVVGNEDWQMENPDG